MKVNETEQSQQRVVGIKYEPGKGLPRVILKGSGDQAREIIDSGKRRNGLPLVKDQNLLEQLYRLPMESEIGPELYELVAALLVHVYAIGEETNRMNQ
jgi:flagellar biosynthesis protein